MIKKVRIQNFKSIYDLEIETGRINTFIGENGSGKSNLLEALVFASASDSNKLDNEFLTSRGIRVTEPKLMRSAYTEETSKETIAISIYTLNSHILYILANENLPYSKWYNINNVKQLQSMLDTATKEIDDEISTLKTELEKSINVTNEISDLDKRLKELRKFTSNIEHAISKEETTKKLKTIGNFLIYSPENSSLRQFYKEGQIEPLGINGEGLLKLLNVINNYDDKSHIKTIKESLELFNWFKAIKIPDSMSHSEDRVEIEDKFLYTSFDQRSANEGFLFILFYITLIVAKETPKVFAIDNIDASLNPKLCTKLMTVLSELAKEYDKQIFLTTHNPAILDGIDLNDDEQKLFTVSRNKSGHTRMKEITVANKPKSSNEEPLKLSEAFLRGYLGALPKGF